MTYPRTIATFTAEGFTAIARELTPNGTCTVTADMDIDVDGSGNPHGDPYFQPDTTLHYQGKALDSDVDKFIVLPLPCLQRVKGIVLGCQARVVNTRNGKFCDAVVGDVGPSRKIGEASRAVALVLDINPSPISGGVDEAVIRYSWQPGVAALVDGRQYALKPLHA